MNHPPHWHKATTLSELDRTGRKLVRVDGRQIALFRTDAGVLACNNRCPHEGYPLCEGDLGERNVLTCNWHNWKFDLSTGENLYGGDRLRVYPVRIRGDEVWVEIVDAPLYERVDAVMRHLHESFDDNDYARMARELARLERIAAEPLDAVREAIGWSYERLEFGWTHAYAGLADWLTLYGECADDAERRLVCLLEGVAHIADDVLREQRYAYTSERKRYHEDQFVEAVESENEAAAVAMVRGAIEQGDGYRELERGLSRAALAHYNDFGHSLIYVTKAGVLIERLGDSVLEPLLCALTRSLVYARREDRIPEFRAYASALAAWGRGDAGDDARMQSWQGLGIDKALQATVAVSAAPPEAIYAALLGANAWNMLAFDIARQDTIAIPVSDNVGWLDFTHAITFAQAVRIQCSKFPELWPAGLLQLACFCGRNASFTRAPADLERWRVADAGNFFRDAVAALYDHGREEFIVSVHLLKTVLAARAEMSSALPGEVREHLAAALRRFLSSPMKRKHTRRTAHQAMKFVALDG